MIRPIKTNGDYKAALKRIDELIDAPIDSLEADELEVLSTLVHLYEEDKFPIDLPDPIDAIKFRMEQQKLSNRDLQPYLGSRAKVSEILSGKRQLTLQMIRALTTNLGIPAEALLGRAGAKLPESPQDFDWNKFPLKAMAKFGWIEDAANLKDRAEEIMRRLINDAGGFEMVPQPMFRKNEHLRENAKMNPYSLKAWCYMVLAVARRRSNGSIGRYIDGAVTLDFCRDLIKSSWSQDGPKLAKEFLEKHGIQLIYLPHLPQTHLDGAALQLADGDPIIALTLRYDRLDNFWFCLLHELAHVALHMKKGERNAFFDDLTVQDRPTRLNDQEREADKWAQDALIPPSEWESSGLNKKVTVEAVLELAHRLGIHPAIVAGRVRKEQKNYRLLTHFVGNGQVSRHFPTASIA